MRRRLSVAVRGGVVAAIALACLAAPTALAQDEPPSSGEVSATEDPPPQPRTPVPLAITVSGGVSLGSYEAGFLHYVTEWIKRNPDRAQLRLATGASAGSTNALYTLLESCSALVTDPSRSLYWTWVELGFDDIFDPERSTALGMFSPHGARYAFDAVERSWKLGLDETCDVLYGATVTRLQSGEVRTQDGNMRLPNLEERFTLRIRGQGVAKAPSLDDYPATARGAQHMKLAVREGEEPSALSELLTASSAFPIAFPPTPLRYCATSSGDPTPCTPDVAEQALFVDGGVFDNTPVSLAVHMMERALSASGPGGGRHINDDPSDVEPALPEDARFIVVAPGLAADARKKRDQEGPPKSVLPMVLQFFTQFISTARSRELAKLLETNPGLSERVLVAPESLPPMSGHMFAFLGFFERKLREFDFALGMHEARRFLERHAQHFGRSNDPVAWVEPPGDDPLGPEIYRQYLCIGQALAGGPAPACQHPSMQDFRALLQVSIEVLHQRCAREGVRGGSLTCDQVRDGLEPVHVDGLELHEGFERGEREGETQYVIRRLSEYRFEFTDLGLNRDDGIKAHARIRESLEQLVQSLARAQRGKGAGQTAGVRTLGRMAANLIEYRPPNYLVHFAIGSPWEVGVSGMLPARKWQGFRWVAGMQVWGIDTLVSSQGRTFGFAPVGGFELEPVRFSGPFLQMRFGGVAGYTFVHQDQFSGQGCDGEGDLAPEELCSRPLTQAYLTLSFVELIRLGVHATVLPKMRRRGDPRLHVVRPNVGVQIPF